MKRVDFIISIILFVLAGMLIFYSIWAFTHCRSYINDAIQSGQLTVKGSEYDIVNFYMSNCGQYTIYAIISVVLGWLILRTPVYGKKISSDTNITIHQSDDSELDKWFEEMQQGKEN